MKWVKKEHFGVLVYVQEAQSGANVS